MSWLGWVYVVLFGAAVVPAAWAVGKAVGMERASWGRAIAFGALEGAACWGGMELVPLDIFALEALTGLFASLLISPLLFRALMTGVKARAVLGALLLAVGAAVLAILVLLV